MALSLLEQSLVRIIQGAKGSFISPKIQVRRFPFMGLGVEVTERLNPGEVVFVASREVWQEYSAAVARQEALIQAPAFVERVDAYCGLNHRMAEAALFATHIVLADPSDVYLQSLPQVVDVPMYWSERRLDELRNCDVLDTIAQARHFYRKMHVDLFGTAPMVSGVAFQWALSVLMSRATSGKDQPFTLIPFFEWFNHTASPSACAHEFVEEDESFVVRTTQAHQPHEQLFINYGDHSPSTFLRHYGFASIEQTRTLDPVKIKEPLSFLDIPDSDPTKRAKLDLLRSRRWPDKKLEPYTIHMNDSSNSVEFEWLRLLVASKEELDHYSNNGRQWLDTNSKRVWSLLRTLCSNRLSMYSTTAEDDLALLQNQGITLEPWLASCVNIRLGEKLVLRSFMDRTASK
ncbi:unnamed protein product [Aphanomyces euteiches]